MIAMARGSHFSPFSLMESPEPEDETSAQMREMEDASNRRWNLTVILCWVGSVCFGFLCYSNPGKRMIERFWQTLESLF